MNMLMVQIWKFQEVMISSNKVKKHGIGVSETKAAIMWEGE